MTEETKKLKNSFVFRNAGLLILIGTLLIIFIYRSCTVYVKPYQFGLKQVNVALFKQKGINQKVYDTGLHLMLPFGLEQMHVFPKSRQVLELSDTRSQQRGRHRVQSQPATKIQTSDGFFVTVDVSIIYRITDPYKLITKIGLLYEKNGIVPKAEPILKEALGTLTTEEFYNSPLRVERTLKAKELFNKEFAPKGIEIEHVLIRYFRYSDEIQRNIEEKKLKDQLVFKNRAEAKAAKEKANLSKIIEEGKAKVRVELEKADAYKIKKEAEIDLYRRKKTAEADLLIKLAEAKKTELKNKALTGAGSAQMVGLKMAEVLKGIKVIVLPSDGKDGFNPINLDKTTELFGINKND